VVNLRLKMLIPVGKPEQSVGQHEGKDSGAARVAEADVVFQQGTLPTGLYQRDLLRYGNIIDGPAVVLQMDSTTSIPPGWTAEVDGYGNLIVEPTE
jgi:N-methylhydantoinase A